MISRWQEAPRGVRRVATLAVLLAGCAGGESAAPEAPSAEVTSSANAGHETANNRDVSHIASPDEKPSMGFSPAEQTQQIESIQEHKAADAAFRRLVTPGTEAGDWDAAQQTLVTLGPKSTLVLVTGLASENPVERETAATVCALMETIDPALKGPLLKCLDDESTFVRANAATALTQFPEYHPQIIATLTSLLDNDDPQLRRMAAANLGTFGAEAKSELSKLTAVLENSDNEVVTPVIELLGRIGPDAVDAVPQLQKIAFEQDGEVKQAAKQALLLIQSDEQGREKSVE